LNVPDLYKVRSWDAYCKRFQEEVDETPFRTFRSVFSHTKSIAHFNFISALTAIHNMGDGFEVVSSEELSDLVMEPKFYDRMKWANPATWVGENVNYLPDGTILIASRDKNPIIKQHKRLLQDFYDFIETFRRDGTVPYYMTPEEVTLLRVDGGLQEEKPRSHMVRDGDPEPMLMSDKINGFYVLTWIGYNHNGVLSGEEVESLRDHASADPEEARKNGVFMFTRNQYQSLDEQMYHHAIGIPVEALLDAPLARYLFADNVERFSDYLKLKKREHLIFHLKPQSSVEWRGTAKASELVFEGEYKNQEPIHYPFFFDATIPRSIRNVQVFAVKPELLKSI
jgi:hypothetical protein